MLFVLGCHNVYGYRAILRRQTLQFSKEYFQQQHSSTPAISILTSKKRLLSSFSTPGVLLYRLMKYPTRVKLGTKTGPTFQYSLFKGFYITKKYHINIYYTSFKLFIHFGYIDIKIDNQAFNLLNSDMFCRKQTISVDFSLLNVSKYQGIILYL